MMMAKMRNMRLHTSMTLKMGLTVRNSALTTRRSDGLREMMRNGRRARSARSDRSERYAELPSVAMEKYEMTTTPAKRANVRVRAEPGHADQHERVAHA